MIQSDTPWQHIPIHNIRNNKHHKRRETKHRVT